ncbi:MAG: glycosyltransferase [Steroidobacteraceae bacterium]
MKILYMNTDRGIPVLGDKGASVHVRAFISAAAALGHEVVLACATLGQGNPAPPANIIHLGTEVDDAAALEECEERAFPASDLDDPIIRREVEHLANDRALAVRLLTALDRIAFKPDLIYERHALFSQSGVRVAAELGVSRLLEVNAPLIAEQMNYRGLRLVVAALAAQACSYRAAAAIIAVSDAVASHVRSVIGPTDKLHVIPNGVDLALFGQPGGGFDIRNQLGLGSGPVVGFVGSFKPWHGIGLLLDAFETLVAGRPELRLVAAGDGPDLPMARARAAKPALAGRVVLPGRIAHADVPAWLAAMDVTVAPYLPQPDFYFSPMKIVESLAAGRPVVAPRIGQIPDLVSDGETGLLFPPGDASALGFALARLIDDPCTRVAMGKAARASAATRGWSSIVRQILECTPKSSMKQTA